MAANHVSFGGWANNLRLTNAHLELIVTLDVGPRIISCRHLDGENVFKTFDEQLGGTGEPEFMARGGHRFWIAPEDLVLTYIPDNAAVQHRVISDFAAEFTAPAPEAFPIQKTLTVSIDPEAPRVTVTHRADNRGRATLAAATWGLSVMRAGGIEIIPLPPLGEHPRDLLPNRAMVLWPYTNMADARWSWGEKFITLRQADALPTKLGLAHLERWAAYHVGRSVFVKEVEFDANAVYPDLGCNFETFTNAEMLEIEALSPLVQLQPGESVSHTEHWTLHENVDAPPRNESDLAAWVSEHRLGELRD